MNYYNEFDPYAAQWLRNLIAARLIPDGYVDERSIVEVRPDDLAPYAQCHFFAGIGGWPLALQLAGWPVDRTVWTGSCPCQPFSCAGRRRGTADARHLWPEFFRLIEQRRPPTVLGEQVASKDGLQWLDGVFADLEGADYACGAADLCAASVGAPHIRQRLYWVAHDTSERCGEAGAAVDRSSERVGECGNADRLADACSPTSERRTGGLPAAQAGIGGSGAFDGSMPERFADGSEADRLADDDDARSQRWPILPQCPNERTPWSSSLVIPCRDGKARRISAESGDVPLAHGISSNLGRPRAILEGMGYNTKEIRRMLRRPRSLLAMAGKCRVGRLKGYGNAIVPQVAAEFIKACMEVMP